MSCPASSLVSAAGDPSLCLHPHPRAPLTHSADLVEMGLHAQLGDPQPCPGSWQAALPCTRASSGQPPRLWTRDPIFPWQREGGKPWEERGPPVHPATPEHCVWAAGEPLSCCTLTAAQRERTGSVRGLGGAELLREISPVPRAATPSRPPPSRGVGAAKPEGLRSGSAPRCPPGPGPASGAQPSRSRGRGALRCAPSRPGCWASPSPACDPEASRGEEGGGGDSVLLPRLGPWAAGVPRGPASGPDRLLDRGVSAVHFLLWPRCSKVCQQPGWLELSSGQLTPRPAAALPWAGAPMCPPVPAAGCTLILRSGPPSEVTGCVCAALGVGCACPARSPVPTAMSRARPVCVPPGTLGPEGVWAQRGGLSQGLPQAQGWVVEGRPALPLRPVLGSLLPVALATRLPRPPA